MKVNLRQEKMWLVVNSKTGIPASYHPLTYEGDAIRKCRYKNAGKKNPNWVVQEVMLTAVGKARLETYQ